MHYVSVEALTKAYGIKPFSKISLFILKKETKLHWWHEMVRANLHC